MSESSESASGSPAEADAAAAAKPAKPAAAAKKPAAAKKVAAKKPAASKSAAAKKESPAAKPAKKAAAAKKPAAKKEAAPARSSRRSSAKKPQRILRIRLRSFDYKQIDTASDVILRTVRQTGSNIRGPIPLPISRERYDLLRSPHVFKDSREQIEIRTYHRLIDVLDPSKKTIEAMSKIELPNGVDPNMKLF